MLCPFAPICAPILSPLLLAAGIPRQGASDLGHLGVLCTRTASGERESARMHMDTIRCRSKACRARSQLTLRRPKEEVEDKRVTPTSLPPLAPAFSLLVMLG